MADAKKQWIEKVRDTLNFLDDCNEDFENTLEELKEIQEDYVKYLRQLETLLAEELDITF